MGMTREQAVAMAESGAWKDMTLEERARFQLFEERLCMPFDKFHEAVENELGRPVWTHEFGSSGNLRKEFLGERPTPSFDEIIALIPEEKRVLIIREEENQ